MTRKKIYPLLVLSSFFMSPLYATSAEIVDLSEEQHPKSFTPFTSELSSKVRCAIHELEGLVKDAEAQERFRRMSEKEFHDDKDKGSSIITKYVNLYKFGYFFYTEKTSGTEYYKKLSPEGLKEERQRLQQNRLSELVAMHKKGNFLENGKVLQLIDDISQHGQRASKRIADELPPIDFKTTLVRTMGMTVRSLKSQPVDKTHHQSEFVEPISGRLFQFDLQTDYSLRTASGVKVVYPYDLTNDALNWEVDFEGREDNQFTYSIFLRGDGEKITIGNITLLKM